MADINASHQIRKPSSKDGQHKTALTRRAFLQGTASLAFSSLIPTVGRGQIRVFESRAIFDEGLNWVSPSRATRLCERIKRAGFNVFIPAVWHGRGTVWPSDLAPWDSANARISGFDPLEHLLKTAKEFELEVHPWFTIGKRSRDFFPEFASPSADPTFNYFDESFRKFAVKLVMEVVERYPIHGINLDYVRFYAPRAREAEVRETAVTDFIRRMKDAAKAVRPDLVISVDAAPYRSSMTELGQNSPRWADEGLVDVVYSMQYGMHPDFEAIQRLQKTMRRPQALVVLVGNYEQVEKQVLPRNAGKVDTLLQQARSVSQGNGVGLYLYSMLSDAQIEYLRRSVFRQEARPSWNLAEAQNPPADFLPPDSPGDVKVR